MNRFWANPPFSSRYVLAAAAGLLLTAAFPKLDVAGAAWLAPGLMVGVALGTNGWERFRIGYVAGLSHYLSMLYWLLLIPYRWHGIPVAPAVGWLALSGFLSLFSGAWVWLVANVRGARSSATSNTSIVPARPKFFELVRSADQSHLAGVLAKRWLCRTGWAIGAAASWVAIEMCLARIFGGFPWDLLGVSQYNLTPLLQISTLTAIYGVSFLVVWVSVSLLSAGLMLIRRPAGRSVWVGETALPVLVVAVLFNTGLRQIRNAPEPSRTVKVALVQPSIPQTLIWNSENDEARFQDLLELTEKALREPADLVIWPEASVPKMLRYDTNTLAAVSSIAQRHHVWLIVGSDDAEPKLHAANPDDADFFNSSFLISPDGEIRQRYVKRNLVIFGEYLPLQNWLPFLKYFTPIQGGFTPGTRSVAFNLRTLQLETAVLICFEDIFPQLARTDVDAGTDFLVNITNDGWFGDSAAQWQHARSSVVRAIENRVPLVRCSNNGLTCWIDDYGRMREILHDNSGSVYGPGYLLARVELPSKQPNHHLTFYTQHGDWFGWGCVSLTLVILGAQLWSRRNSPATASADVQAPGGLA